MSIMTSQNEADMDTKMKKMVTKTSFKKGEGDSLDLNFTKSSPNRRPGIKGSGKSLFGSQSNAL